MRKYIDMIGYPVMILAVYILIGIVNWDRDPGTWSIDHRIVWIVWGLAWGFALSLRIKEK